MTTNANSDLHALRLDYLKGELNERDISADPIAQFAKWFNEAAGANIPDVNAMAVATTDARGVPSVRTCLLKSFDESGFTFFTNLLSRKGRDLKENPKASLCFFWQPLERQVRIDGDVEPVDRKTAETYFQSRPLASQIAATISHQSEVIASRDALEKQHAQLMARHANDKALPLPDSWGGYRVVPHAIEFWQGRASRLHDRLLYTRQADRKWLLQRLAP